MAEATLQPCRMPAGFSENDFNFFKLFKCVLFEGKRVMTNVVQKVYSSLPASNGGTMTLKEYLSNHNWKKQEMESFVTKLFLPILTADVMDSDFDVDITLAYKLLTKVFSEVFEKLSSKCQEDIRYLKCMRNKLSHLLNTKEVIKIKSEISTLKGVFRKIYQGFGTVLSLDLSLDSEFTEQILNEILEAKVTEDYEGYKKQLEEFQESLTHRLLSDGQNELSIYYSQLRVVNPCTWMLDEVSARSSLSKCYIEKIYTPLLIKGNCGGEKCEIDTKNLLTTTKLVRKNFDVLPTAMILYGLAGCGKTSLCRYILHDWRNSNGHIHGLKEMDLVILVEVRNVRGETLREFLIEQLLSKTYKKLKVDLKTSSKITANIENELISTLQELRILFVIDGFDEATKETKKVIEDIFGKFRKSPDHRIIVTTRPESLEEVGNRLSRYNVEYLVEEICGFDDAGIKDFTIKVFHVALQHKYADNNEAKQHKYTSEHGLRFLEYIDGRGRILEGHLKLPLTLALLIHLWIDDKKALSKVTNCTTLYFELFKLCQMKVKERLQGECMDIKVINGLLMFIGEVAWELLCKNKVKVTTKARQRIEEECKQKKVNKTEMMSAFLVCNYDENQDSVEHYEYEFLHKTQMEYLAAGFLVDHVNVKGGELKDVTIGVEDWSKFPQVIIFFVGHLAILSVEDQNYSIESVFQLVNKADIREGNYDFWWKFLVEAKKNRKVAKIIATENLPRNRWELNNININHIVPGLELLGSIPTEIESLKIEVTNSIDPYNIKNLFEVMKELRSLLCFHYNKKNPLLTELHFWHHNEHSCDKHTDDLMRTLQPWGHLTHLTGSLGEQEQGKELLNCCFKLKTLRVRLCSVKAVVCLSASLEKIHRSIRQLRVTLAITPGSVDPTSFPILSSKGDMEVTIPGTQDKDKEWVVVTVKCVAKGKGCKHLIMDKSELSCDSVLYLMKHLRRVVLNKLSVQTVCDITDEEKILVEAKENDTHITVNWIP